MPSRARTPIPVITNDDGSGTAVIVPEMPMEKSVVLKFTSVVGEKWKPPPGIPGASMKAFRLLPGGVPMAFRPDVVEMFDGRVPSPIGATDSQYLPGVKSTDRL